MRRFLFIVVLAAVASSLMAADWPSQSGNPQRDGWAQGENEIVKSAIPQIRLLYKRKFDNQSRGLNSLTSPIILGNLITYRGFKEMLFVGGSSDVVYSVDAALNVLLWKSHFEYQGDEPQASPTEGCPGGLTASVAIVGGSGPMRRSFSFHRKREQRPRASSPLFASGFGSNGYVFAIGSDGYLRFVRQSDGNDKAIAPIKFLPANAKVSSINVDRTMVYAATVGDCGGSANALYAIDLGGDAQKVLSFPTNGSGFSGIGGTAVGVNGIVYAQVANGHGDVAGEYRNTVLALDPASLQVKDYFTPSDTRASATKKEAGYSGITPAVFTWKNKELIVAGGADGTIYLLDSASLGGRDHHTPLAHTEPLVKPNSGGLTGDFSTWEDEATNTRWIYAAVTGPVSGRFPQTNGGAKEGGIVAFKVDEHDGKFSLEPQWISRNLTGPASPITTNGLVVALSSGVREASRNKATGHATMYILDGSTGKELFSTGNDAATFSYNTGLALANGRIYFATHDNTVYCYGLPAMQPQLTEH
jgi:outer membrane protein assembly factor BamB